uniref:60S ribosomal protein L36 n=1 Tax=Trichuris muris TaxID=70415 RepID=A0A5S6QGU8_TRIMR
MLNSEAIKTTIGQTVRCFCRVYWVPFVDMGLKYEIAVGPNKGHKVTKLPKRKKPSNHKGKLNKRVKFVRDVVREVCGFAPYEKRAMELLRISRDKKALRYLKRRIGGHRRSKRKRDEMQGVLIAMRKAHAHK